MTLTGVILRKKPPEAAADRLESTVSTHGGNRKLRGQLCGSAQAVC